MSVLGKNNALSIVKKDKSQKVLPQNLNRVLNFIIIHYRNIGKKLWAMAVHFFSDQKNEICRGLLIIQLKIW